MCGGGAEDTSESIGGRSSPAAAPSGSFAASVEAPGLGASSTAAVGAGESKAESEGNKAKSRKAKGQVIGTILGALSPVPGGAAVLSRLGGAIAEGKGERPTSPGELESQSAGGESRQLTSFPKREEAAKAVLASEQDKRRALRGRKSTILTSPGGVTTTGPQRKTLLGQ